MRDSGRACHASRVASDTPAAITATHAITSDQSIASAPVRMKVRSGIASSLVSMNRAAAALGSFAGGGGLGDTRTGAAACFDVAAITLGALSQNSWDLPKTLGGAR